MQQTVETKSPASLQAKAFVRNFEILNDDKKTEALQELALALSSEERQFLQNRLKPLINYGVTIDDSRVHYVIVPLPAIRVDAVDDFINGVYVTGGNHYFGDMNNIDLIFISTADDNGTIDSCYNITRTDIDGDAEFKELTEKLVEKDRQMFSAGRTQPYLYSIGLCFKIDPTGVWKVPNEQGFVVKETQTGIPLAMTRYCVDLCSEGHRYFKDRTEIQDLTLLQMNCVKYHYFDVEIGNQTRRVVYLEPDPSAV